MAEEGAALLLGLGKPKGSSKGGDQEAKEDAANDILDAISSKDAGALAEAMATMYDLCAKYEDEETSDRMEE